MFVILLSAFIAFIPAMLANSLAAIVGGGSPIDGGKKIGGKRILGDGKTWRGLIGGGLSAGLIGIFFAFALDPTLDLYPASCGAIVVIFSLSFGSLLGDIGASFIKRRIGKKRGESIPFLDQYDFVIGAMIFTLIFSQDWVLQTYFFGDSIYAFLLIILMIPLLHRATNILGYKIGMKKEPW